ncbi:MAG: OadG family protein [Chloroflexota bacterium]
MNPTIVNSLWITLLGMGLVFAALILLAGLMSLMTRFFRDKEALTPAPLPQGEGKEDDLVRAAVAAVTAALAEQAQPTARPITPPEPTIIGAWQLGMRTRQMTQKGQMGRKGKD